MKQIQIGDLFTQSFVVTQIHTAKHLGSGNLDVFATPAMIACMENTALKLVQSCLEPGFDTVGTEICANHLKASKIGETIVFEARIIAYEGKKIQFEISAKNELDATIGKANL